MNSDEEKAAAPDKPEKLEAFMTVSADGWLTMSIPLNVKDGDIMAFGVLRKAEMMICEFLDRQADLRRQMKGPSLVLPKHG
jgi:hypothetical protein